MTIKGNKTGWKRGLVLLGGGVIAIVGGILLKDSLGFEALRENQTALTALRDANPWLTAGAFVVFYVLVVAFSLPGATLATLTGGFLFGTALGAALNVGSATLGAVLIFLAARYGVGTRLQARIDTSDGRIRRIKDGIDNNQWSMLFLLRLAPVVPFFIANLLPAFLAVPLSRFIVSTFLGIIPAAVVFTSVGAGLGDVFAQGRAPNLGVIFEPHILLPILGLCLLAILPMVLKAAMAKKVF